MNIASLLADQCLRRGSAAAIIETVHGRSKTISFSELEGRTARAAAMLRATGLAPGDRVLVLHPMSIDLYAVLLSLFRAGLVATFLDPSAGRAHIDRCCEIAEPAALIASSKAHLLRFVSHALRRIPHHYSIGFPLPFTSRWESWQTHEPKPDVVERGNDDPALLTFTSGSTGRPKAAVRTHGFLLAQHAALAEAIELAPGQVDLSTLPIFTLANLASGVTTLIPDADLKRPGSVQPDPIMRQIRQYRPDRVVASPAFLHLLALCSEASGESLDSLTRIYTGGAPVFPWLLERLQRVAPNAKVVAVYGSTEAEPIAHIHWRDMSASDVTAMESGSGLLAGDVVPQIQLRIVPNRWGTKLGPYSDQEFRSSCLPAGARGEIVVYGGHVLKGYLDGVGDEQTKFSVDGAIWHRTGDAGYLDERGRLWLLGRAEAVIRDERGELYPFAVECAAMRVPGVCRAALIAIDGQRLLAVELDPQIAPSSTFAGNILKSLAWAKLDRVQVLRSIPVDKRHNAKVDYPALRAMMERES